MEMSMATEVKLFGVVKSVVVPIETVCAWCPDGQQKTKEAHARGVVVSHGMCKACQEKVAEQEYDRR